MRPHLDPISWKKKTHFFFSNWKKRPFFSKANKSPSSSLLGPPPRLMSTDYALARSLFLGTKK